MWEYAKRFGIGVFHGDGAALSILAELLIIAAGVYAVLRFLRGTRGASVFRGVAFLLLSVTLILKVVAETFRFDRILAIYPNFVLAVFFVAIIVFQPELRRALMRLGATGWLPGLRTDVNAMLDELVEAVSFLSKRKVGALIAIERATELGDIASGGCKVDAEVSAQLLNTIFWPGSALHDMGVIIAHNRITRAAVLFPLTEADLNDPSMGSRHRAALGLSEESDAIIVVVSEETGIISLAEHGRLIRSLTPEVLRSELETRLSAKSLEPESEPMPADDEPRTIVLPPPPEEPGHDAARHAASG